MRIFVPLGTLVLTALAALPVSAQMDLDSLLGELTYGESQLVSDNADETDTELLPAPAAQTDAVAESAEDQSASQGSSLLPVNPGPPLPDAMLGERLKSRPKPAVQAPAANVPSAPVQSYSAPVTSPMQSQAYATGTDSPQQHSYTSATAAVSAPAGNCGCSGGNSCQSCSAHGHRHRGLLSHHRGEACDSPYECRPHVRPTLPQASSSIEYFYSKNAHSDLWAGYAQEAQRRDDRYMKHVRGECDCLNEKHKKSCLSYRPPVYRAAAKPAPCAQCESGACDAHHH